MKKLFQICFFVAASFLFVHNICGQSVAINTDATPPASSAMLDIKSTTKGLLIPRMSSVQRTGIIAPVQGLQVYDITTNTFWFYNGSAWNEMMGSGSSESYWAQDGSGNISNTNAGKIALGTNSFGPGYLNLKMPLNLSGLFMSETGTNTADYLSIGTYAGGGTTSTRYGSITGNFGNGFQLGNQSNAPLMFQVYTSERMRITPAGYVGINTSTPASQLEVKAATASAGLTLTDGTGRLSTYVNNASVSIGTTTNHPIFFFTNSTNGSVPVMTLSTAGNVGIGGITASTKLEVASGDGQWGMTHNSSGGIHLGTYTGSNVGWIATKSNHGLAFATSLGNTNSFAQMMLLPNGNFGIGTGAPGDKLTVQTPTNNYGVVHTDNNVVLTTFVGGSAITGGWLGTRSNHPIGFFTNNGAAQMVILQNGNIGIGTTNPQYKLAVNGVVHSKEVRVESGWADYVFEKDYTLKPLLEVEEFIKVNKHLPGIPAAHEIQKNGLALGEVQSKMMEKIEELTLYVIALEKQINQLKNASK